MPRSPKLPHRVAAACLATAAFAGAAAGTASADSIAYLKGGDVWLTTTDAARQFQVTGTGAYFAVSQADDGTIVATTKAGTLQRLDRFGQILSEITTPVSQPTNGGSTVFVGPLDADVSPDGKTVAYGFIKMGAYKYPDGSMDADMYDGHGFTRADQATVGIDRCRGRMIADPALDHAVVEVEAWGTDGSYLTTVKRQPMVGVSGTEMFQSTLRSVLKATGTVPTMDFL